MFKTLALKEIVCVRNEFSMEIKMDRGRPYIASTGHFAINNDEIMLTKRFLERVFSKKNFTPSIRAEYGTIMFYWDELDSIPFTIKLRLPHKRTAPDDCIFFRRREATALRRFLNEPIPREWK